MKNKIITMMLMMLFLVTTVFAVPTDPTEFSEGLTITLADWDYHFIDTNLTLHSHIYNSRTGMLLGVDEANCSIAIHKLSNSGYENIFEMNSLYQGEMTFPSTLFNETGSYNFDLACFDVATSTMGGHRSINYDVVEETSFGLWTPVDDWTFPIIYLILTIVLLGFAISYSSSIMGVLGSIMLIFSYFLVGATSPILFTPLLIVGFLLAFKFATLD